MDDEAGTGEAAVDAKRRADAERIAELIHVLIRDFSHGAPLLVLETVKAGIVDELMNLTGHK